MSKFPSLSSRELMRLLEKGGAEIIRQGPTDHTIYARLLKEGDILPPIQTDPKTLDPITVNGYLGS